MLPQRHARDSNDDDGDNEEEEEEDFDIFEQQQQMINGAQTVKQNKNKQDEAEEQDFDVLDLAQQQEQQQANGAPSTTTRTKSIIEMKDVLITISSFLALFDIISMRRINKFFCDEFDFKFKCKNYNIYFEYKNVFIVDIIKQQICANLSHLSMHFLQLQNYGMGSFCFNVIDGDSNDVRNKNISNCHTNSNNLDVGCKYLTSYQGACN